MKAFENVVFDEEIFTEYMEEQSCLNTALLASGVYVHDPIIESRLGDKGNVFTAPFFLPVDSEGEALNYDGKTNNTPTKRGTNAQTGMAIARMKAWEENTYVRYLSGVSPLQHLADKLVIPYWQREWLRDMLAITKGILGVAGMEDHKSSYELKDDLNLYAVCADLVTKANGDKNGEYSLLVAHSMIVNQLRKMEVIEFRKYTDANAQRTWEIPYLGNMAILETDTEMVEGTSYLAYMFGHAAFIGCPKKVDRPYTVAYDAETNGGVEKLYTKQAKVMHPNGFSIQVENIAEESPTRAELAAPANWALKFNHKNVKIAQLTITQGA